MTWLRHRHRAAMAMEAAPTTGRQRGRLFSWVKTGTKAKVEGSMAAKRRGGNGGGGLS